MMSRRIHFVVWIVSAVFTSPLLAVPLSPGTFVNLSGTTEAARPELAGAAIEDVIRPFSVDLGGGNFTTGTIQDRVVRETGTGTLDFYYFISDDVSSAGSIDFVTRTDYTGFSTDVDLRSDGVGTVNPDQASRSAGGDQVLFDFFANNLLGPGQASRGFFIKTEATAYNARGKGSLAISSDSLGGGTFNFDTFQPDVPEPGAALALLGIAGIGLRRLRHD